METILRPLNLDGRKFRTWLWQVMLLAIINLNGFYFSLASGYVNIRILAFSYWTNRLIPIILQPIT